VKIQRESRNVSKIERMRIRFNVEESSVIFRSPPHLTSICQIYSSTRDHWGTDIWVINSLWHLHYP